jgi:hypothetical protein
MPMSVCGRLKRVKVYGTTREQATRKRDAGPTISMEYVQYEIASNQSHRLGWLRMAHFGFTNSLEPRIVESFGNSSFQM